MGDDMGIDIRIPIGLMFTILGALLVVYGIFTSGNAMYVSHSLGININIWWGFVLLIFGSIMLWLGRRVKS